jgi:transcription factor C subunit 6
MKSNKKAKKKKQPKPKKSKGKGKAREEDGVADESQVNEAENNGGAEAGDVDEDDDDEDDDYADPDTLASISWPPEVAVTRVAWHRSLRRAHILASGMACGLVRVDVVNKPWTLELPPRFLDLSSILQGPDEDDDD